MKIYVNVTGRLIQTHRKVFWLMLLLQITEGFLFAKEQWELHGFQNYKIVSLLQFIHSAQISQLKDFYVNKICWI